MKKIQLSCENNHHKVVWHSNSKQPACPICRRPINTKLFELFGDEK